MAVWIVYLMGAPVKGPGNYHYGDVVDILPNGVHPGLKAASIDKFGYVTAPGTVAFWKKQGLLEPNMVSVGFDPDGVEEFEMRGRRKFRTNHFDSKPVLRNKAKDWATHPKFTKATLLASIEARAKFDGSEPDPPDYGEPVHKHTFSGDAHPGHPGPYPDET